MTKERTCMFLRVTTAVLCLVGFGGLVLALTSFFLFDAPGSEKNPATILLFVCALTLPVTSMLSIAVPWICYARKHYRAACLIAFVPVLNLAGGAGALIWLEIFNGGRFN